MTLKASVVTKLRFVFMSDTHLAHDSGRGIRVPEGDILVHAGDSTYNGTPKEIDRFSSWLRGLPFKRFVVIAGNHDWLFQTNLQKAVAHLNGCADSVSDARISYLQDSGVNIEGRKIWGSPWTPRFFDWAFNLDRGTPLRKIWSKMPAGLDLLVTHGPPMGIGDKTMDGESVGDEELFAAICSKPPRAHVFGHIHCAHGLYSAPGAHTIFMNAAICDEAYKPTNDALVLDL